MRLLPFVLIAFLFPAVSYPCTCAFPTFEEQVKSATAIFRGKVIQIEAVEEDQIQVRITVVKNWKGPDDKIITVFSGEHSAMCGYPFKINKEYLVFADGKEKLEVSLCSRTKQIGDATEDLAQLEKKDEKTEPKRDPFSEKTVEKNQSDKLIPRELNITHAVIVGITKKADEYVALIRATSNKVYFLKVGDKLHDGTVLRIDSNSVTFRKYRGYRSVLVRKELRPFPDQ